MKTAAEWLDELYKQPHSWWKTEIQASVGDILNIQDDALEAAAGIVENYCKCRCGPEWGKRHDPACIYADGVEMAESIRELKSETKP